MKNPNAKNPDFEVPVDLPSVTPEDYSKAIASGNGSAKAPPVKPNPSKTNH